MAWHQPQFCLKPCCFSPLSCHDTPVARSKDVHKCNRDTALMRRVVAFWATACPSRLGSGSCMHRHLEASLTLPALQAT